MNKKPNNNTGIFTLAIGSRQVPEIIVELVELLGLEVKLARDEPQPVAHDRPVVSAALALAVLALRAAHDAAEKALRRRSVSSRTCIHHHTL